MSATLIAYQLLLVASTITSFCVAIYAWRQQEVLGARAVAWFNIGAFVWTFVTLISTVLGRTGLETPLLWYPFRLIIPAVGVLVISVVMFTLEYTGRSEYLTRRTFGLLAIEPVIATGLTLTAGWHSLFWVESSKDTGAVFGYVHTFELGFLLHTIYSYLLLAGCFVLLIQFVLRSEVLYRKQVVAVLGGIAVPWAGNAIYIFTEVQYDLTQSLFVVTGITLTWAITRAKFLDLTPAARNTVVETLDAGVFVVDADGRLVDINQRGRQLLGLEGQEVIGHHVEEILSSMPEVKSYYDSLVSNREPEKVMASVGLQTYHVRATPLFDDRNLFGGHVFFVDDITDQVDRKKQLERQNEQLDRFAKVLTHDLRNPVTVANGYLELAAEDCESPHLDNVAEAHKRIDRIIENVRTLTRTDTDTLSTRPVSLTTVANAAWDGVETDSATMQIDGDGTLQANHSLFQQLLENLFRNAIEHAGSTVTVTIGLDGDTLSVADDGPGIAPEIRETVFEETVSTSDSTGLGLTIVAEVANAHGWDVSVAESATGGARFEIQIPDTEHN